MNDAELNFAEGYLRAVKNMKRLLEETRNNRNAPIDAVLPIESSLKAHRESNVSRILEILLQDAIDRELLGEIPYEESP